MNMIPICQAKEPDGLFRLAAEMGIPFRVTGGLEITHEMECSGKDLDALRILAIEQGGATRWVVFRRLGPVYRKASAIEKIFNFNIKDLLNKGFIEQNPEDPELYRYKRDPDVDGGWSVLG